VSILLAIIVSYYISGYLCVFLLMPIYFIGGYSIINHWWLFY
jgi:hypothetical protein